MLSYIFSIILYIVAEFISFSFLFFFLKLNLFACFISNTIYIFSTAYNVISVLLGYINFHIYMLLYFFHHMLFMPLYQIFPYAAYYKNNCHNYYCSRIR